MKHIGLILLLIGGIGSIFSMDKVELTDGTMVDKQIAKKVIAVLTKEIGNTKIPGRRGQLTGVGLLNIFLTARNETIPVAIGREYWRDLGITDDQASIKPDAAAVIRIALLKEGASFVFQDPLKK